MALFRSAAVAAVLAASGMPSASAQRVIEIAGVPTCGECRIVAEKVLTLRPPPSALRFRLPDKVIRDSRGRWYVLDPTGAPFVAVFDSNGKFARRLSYPSGQGISDGVVTTGDTVRLYGLFTSSFADFGPDGNLLRTQPLFQSGSAVTGATPLTRGRIVIQANGTTPDLFGYPYHVLSPDGTRERSFGAAPNESSVGGSFNGMRKLAAARPEGFWSARVNRYEVSRWSDNAELRSTLRRTVDWFPPWESWDSRVDATLPPPFLVSVWQDASDRLWVLSLVAAKDWKAYDRASRPVGDAAVRADMHNRAYDTIMEVIDLRSGRPLVSRRFPEAFMAFTADGFVMEDVTGEAADVAVGLWRVAFIRTGGAP
jgi:hypothetical protein